MEGTLFVGFFSVSDLSHINRKDGAEFPKFRNEAACDSLVSG